MSQVSDLAADQAAWYSAVASAGFTLAPNLVPANTLDFSTEDTADYNAFLAWAQSTATNPTEWRARTEMALALFLDQRRKTRNWILAVSVSTAVLGGVFGYFVGRPGKSNAM